MVTDTYRPRVNGVVTSLDTFAREFEQLGHRVTILAPDFPGAVPEANVLRFPSHYLWFDPEDRLANPWLPAARRLARSLPGLGFDLLHTQTPFTLGCAAFAWGRQLKVPVVHTFHTLFTSYVEHYIRFVPRRLSIPLVVRASRSYCDRCRLVVTPSSQMREELRGYGVSAPVEVVPTGIKLERLAGADGAAFRAGHGVPAGAKMLLYMGRLGREKNVDFLLRVFKRLTAEFPAAVFVVAGEGPARPELEALAGSLGVADHVRFPGYLSGATWAGAYAAADLFVFASVTETQGLVVTEAQAVGTPVVAVGAMGVLDVLGDGRGGTLVPLDEEAFAAAARRYLADPAFHAAQRTEALAHAREWTSAAMARKMLGLYARAISDS